MPAVFDESEWQSPQVFEFGHSSAFENAVTAHGGFKSVAAQTDAALLGMHAVAEIAFAYRGIDEEYDTQLGPWHHWSALQTKEADWQVINAVCATARDGGGLVFSDLMRLVAREIAALPAGQRKKTNAALGAKVRRWLAEAAQPRYPETLEEKLAVWRSLRGSGPNRAYQYYVATGMGDSLLANVFERLGKEGRWAKAAEVAIDVIDSPAGMGREEFTERVVLALVRAGDLAEARRRLLVAMKPKKLPFYATLGWLELLLKIDRYDDAATVLAYATDHFSYFALSARRAGFDVKKVKQVKLDSARYKALFVQWFRAA